jgi:RNA polymerase sigma-70 factor (ECF subfamily)
VAQSDAELARDALAGSQAAYQMLVARYATAAVNVASRLVNDRAVGEELAQDAFVRALTRLETYDPERRFSAWFFKILHNVVVDHLRRKRIATVSLDALEAQGVPPPPASVTDSSPETELERRALAAALDTALRRIRLEYREAILLRYKQDLGVGEISEALGVPVGTVKTYLFRGRKELAAILAAAGWAPRSAETTEDVVP